MLTKIVNSLLTISNHTGNIFSEQYFYQLRTCFFSCSVWKRLWTNTWWKYAMISTFWLTDILMAGCLQVFSS